MQIFLMCRNGVYRDLPGFKALFIAATCYAVVLPSILLNVWLSQKITAWLYSINDT